MDRLNLSTKVTLLFAALALGACVEPAPDDESESEPGTEAAEQALFNTAGSINGFVVEACKLSNGVDLHEYVRWDKGNIFLISAPTTSLDLNAPDASGPNAPAVYEYTEDAVCHGHKIKHCTSTAIAHIAGQPGVVVQSTLNWTYRKHDERLSIFTGHDPVTGVRGTCSDFQVRGPTCLAAMARMRAFAQANGIQQTAVDLSDSVCDE